MDLHKRMLSDVWRWAGEFRKSEKNLGVNWYQINVEFKMLLDDCEFWIEHNTFPEDEIAIRLKHGIVAIHCFANGNGRHSRLIADIITEKIFNRAPFTWGSKSLVQYGNERASYISALRQADNNNFEPLILFARS